MGWQVVYDEKKVLDLARSALLAMDLDDKLCERAREIMKGARATEVGDEGQRRLMFMMGLVLNAYRGVLQNLTPVLNDIIVETDGVDIAKEVRERLDKQEAAKNN